MHEVERPRRRHVREDRVERRLDAQHGHRDQKQDDVERQDDVADLQQVCAG